jgi:hypothetical protein
MKQALVKIAELGNKNLASYNKLFEMTKVYNSFVSLSFSLQLIFIFRNKN